MLDFEQLSVYQKSLDLSKCTFDFLRDSSHIDRFLQDQLKRSITSIPSNIAEGVGRFTLADRRHFYVIARGSAFESYAHIQIIANQYSVDRNRIALLQSRIEEITKMLFGLIKNVQLKFVHTLETRT